MRASRTLVIFALAILAALLALAPRRPGATASAAEATEPVLVSVTPAELAEVLRSGDGPVLVNVWATWCVPCREEFPDILRIRERYRDAGLRVVLVSADFDRQREQARRFLAAQGVDFTTYHKSGDDEQFIDALSSKWSGALPATFVFDGRHRLVQWWEGKASFDAFERTVHEVMGDSVKGEPR